MFEVIFDTPWLKDGKYWSHVSSNDVNRLHEVVVMAGLKRKWFQDDEKHPHYDTYSNKIREALIMCGAKQVDRREYVKKVEEWHKNYRSQHAPLTDESKMPFGSFRHMIMAKVPARHLLWLYEQPWMGKSSNQDHKKVKAYIESNMDVIRKEAAEAQG